MTDILVYDYLKNTLGIEVELEPLKNKGKLPLYLRSGYRLSTFNLLNYTLLLAQPQADSDTTPAGLKKQLDILKEHTGLYPVLLLERIDSFLRKRLIEYKISFIVPGTQMYLPLLMIDLREYFSKKVKKTETVSPSAQVILLYDLYNKLQRPITPIQLGDKCGYTKMTMSRVVDKLESMGICRVEQKGKNRFAWFELEGIALWEKVNFHLRSPVLKKVYACFSEKRTHTTLPKAGISALAETTLLSPGDIPVFAVSKEQLAGLKQEKKIDVVENEFDAQFQLEIWSYNPTLLNGHNTVDNLSLFLSLRDEQDERIQLALKELMENFKWR